LKVRRANSERARLTRLQKKEIGLATMLMVVVFVFFVCNVLALVVNILEVMKIQIIALNNVSNLLVIILNSFPNFGHFVPNHLAAYFNELLVVIQPQVNYTDQF
jgi:hypothetical protein